MSSRQMKWHIYDSNHKPLCWDGKALEFDNEQSAKNFIFSATMNTKHDDNFYQNIEIVEDVLYYDGGYLNATNLRVYWDKNSKEIILIQ